MRIESSKYIYRNICDIAFTLFPNTLKYLENQNSRKIFEHFILCVCVCVCVIDVGKLGTVHKCQERTLGKIAD